MTTTGSASGPARVRLWTAGEFLDWLQPGAHADLIDGFRVRRSWLRAEAPVEAGACLADILG